MYSRKLHKNDLRRSFDYLSENETFQWNGEDNKINFEKNLKKYDNEYLHSYKQNPIKYKLNNFGFRTHDDYHYSDSANIFLGCSHTYGTGHHLENTWGSIVNNKLDNGGKFYNFGAPGTGSTTHLRFFLGWYDYPKNVNAVFHFIPPHIHARYEFFYNGMPHPFGIGTSTIKDDTLFGNAMETIFAWEVQSDFNVIRDINTIENICNKNNIPYILCNTELFGLHPDREGYRWARDCAHLTLEDHEDISKYMLTKYNNIING